MNLLIANASGKLTKHLALIKEAFGEAEKICKQKLGLTNVDVVVVHDPTKVIPEVGISGFAQHESLVYIYLDGAAKVTNLELLATLYHELHHAKRYQGPGYGKSLFDSIIWEGLATRFEEEVLDKASFVVKTIREYKDVNKLIHFAKPHFKDTKFDHFKWFIYDNEKKLPRWTGYVIGYHIVGKYIKSKKIPASKLVMENAKEFREK